MDLDTGNALGGAVMPAWAITDSVGTSSGAGPSQMGVFPHDVSVAVHNDPGPGSASSTKFVMGSKRTKPPPTKPAPTKPPPTKPAGKGKAPVARSQKPAAARDDRGESDLIAVVKKCATYDKRGNPNGSSWSNVHSPTLESLNPQNAQWGKEYGVAEDVVRESARGLTEEKRAEITRLATEHKERTVDLPRIRERLLGSTWTGVEEEGSEAHMRAAGLSSDEKRIFRTYSAFEQMGALHIGTDDADLLDHGLSLAQSELATEAQIVIPPLCTPDNFNVTNMTCAYGCTGCLRRGAQVPLMSQIHAVEVMRTDPKTADACIIALVKSLVMTNESNSLNAMQVRVAKTVCCNSCDCKLAAGVISIADRLKHNESLNQDANQVNGNRRYSSDKNFEDSMGLARRLYLEYKDEGFGKVEARRLVEDTAQFAYWLVARGQDAIGTCHAFIEKCVELGIPWSVETCQTFLDRASSVPRNHVLGAMADHVVSPLESFGVTDKRTWDKYLTDCLCKFMYPDPLTGIALFVRVKNWDANGRPVRVDAQGKTKLLDYVDRNHAGMALMGTAEDFHTAVEPFMTLRAQHKICIPSSSSEGALGQGTQTASYQQSFRNIEKSMGTGGAIARAMMAKFMHANGTDDKSSVTLQSMIRTNGTKKGSQFAPACATLFLNNNVTPLWRVIHWAKAYGLDADFEYGCMAEQRLTRVKLGNFSTEHLPSLFLKSCRDKSKDGQGANGHMIVPSVVVDATGAGAGAGAAAVSTEQYRATSQPLGKGLGAQLQAFNTACAGCKGVPSGFGFPEPDDQMRFGKNAKGRTDWAWETEKNQFCEKAPTETAAQHALDNYNRLLQEKVLDQKTTPFVAYATMDVAHQLMLWQISRERQKKVWYFWLQEVKPDLFAELVAAGRLEAEWCVGMSEDPAGTADGDIKTNDDYLAAINACKKRAKELVIRLKDLPGGVPAEPAHFSYWCSVHRLDPGALWPTDRELRTQFAQKTLLRHESELLKLREGVKIALDKERGTSLRQLRAGATQQEKEARVAEDREESARWTHAIESFQDKSRLTDRVLKPRLGRWLRGETRDDDTDEEKEHMLSTEKLYAQDLEMRFGGGAAHELERRRAALGKHLSLIHI